MTRGTSVLVAVSSRREWIWPLTRFASRKWTSGLNRISHPDWVKFSVELNSAPNQNTRFSSSLQYSLVESVKASDKTIERKIKNSVRQVHSSVTNLKWFWGFSLKLTDVFIPVCKVVKTLIKGQGTLVSIGCSIALPCSQCQRLL